jgi:surfeit locus 1 family protein
MSSTRADAGGRRFRFLLWPTVTTLLGLAVLLSLGTWQVRRLAWKEGLVADIERGLAAPSVEIGPGTDLESLDFRHVTARGAYLHDAAMAFGVEASGNEPGARLATPFRLEDGRVILVGRGWLPESLLPPRVPGGLEPRGPVTLTGIGRARVDPQANWLTPANDPARRRWFSWDVPAMARATGLPLEPFEIVLERSEGPAGLPRTMPYHPEIPNNHLSYAITWYGLAAGLLAVYLLFSFRTRDER